MLNQLLMAIFNSYVKLPEGNSGESWLIVVNTWLNQLQMNMFIMTICEIAGGKMMESGCGVQKFQPARGVRVLGQPFVCQKWQPFCHRQGVFPDAINGSMLSGNSNGPIPQWSVVTLW